MNLKPLYILILGISLVSPVRADPLAGNDWVMGEPNKGMVEAFIKWVKAKKAEYSQSTTENCDGLAAQFDKNEKIAQRYIREFGKIMVEAQIRQADGLSIGTLEELKDEVNNLSGDNNAFSFNEATQKALQGKKSEGYDAEAIHEIAWAIANDEALVRESDIQICLGKEDVASIHHNGSGAMPSTRFYK